MKLAPGLRNFALSIPLFFVGNEQTSLMSHTTIIYMKVLLRIVVQSEPILAQRLCGRIRKEFDYVDSCIIS
jgi:hypothetical protein